MPERMRHIPPQSGKTQSEEIPLALASLPWVAPGFISRTSQLLLLSVTLLA